jgi:hypothetical protein
MATVLTTQLINNTDSSEELVVVIGEIPGVANEEGVVGPAQGISIAIDYSSKLERLADAFDLHNSYLGRLTDDVGRLTDDVERLTYLADPDSIDWYKSLSPLRHNKRRTATRVVGKSSHSC